MERTDNHKSVRLRQNQQTHSGRPQVGPALGDHYRAGSLAPSAQCGFFGRVDSQLSRQRERDIWHEFRPEIVKVGLPLQSRMLPVDSNILPTTTTPMAAAHRTADCNRDFTADDI